MGIFDFAKDLVNGITPALKKKYSPFLSAVLLYQPEFKIIELGDSGGKAHVISQSGGYQYEILIKKNDSKIDELRTTIYDFLNKQTLNYIASVKPLGVFLSYEEFKSHKIVSNHKMTSTYLDIMSIRSYVNYLRNHPRQEKLNVLLNFGNSNEKGFGRMMNNTSQFWGNLYDDPFTKWDSDFKGMNHNERIRIANTRQDLSDFSRWDAELNRKQEHYEALEKYKTMDVWYLKMTVKRNAHVIYEDIEITDGNNGNKLYMHEDDFLFFSKAIESIMNRFNNFK